MRKILSVVLLLCFLIIIGCGGGSSESDDGNGIVDTNNGTNSIVDDTGDDDNDGIVNVDDDCPGTEAGNSIDINGCSDFQKIFISTWDTRNTYDYGDGRYTTNNNQIKLPMESEGIYDFTVDWGDGATDHISEWDQVEATHTYVVEGVYDITITGTIEGFGFLSNGIGDNEKLIDIKQWGAVKLHNKGSQFSRATGLTVLTATDLPNLKHIWNMDGMFNNASSFNHDISGWDVSSVEFMGYMFAEADSFNQYIGGWDVSNVKYMEGMFSGAELFNKDIGDWDVGNVELMNDMFHGAISFNQDINSWDVSNVEDMYSMFYNAQSFDGDLTDWDVSNDVDFGYMFIGSGLEGNEPDWYTPPWYAE